MRRLLPARVGIAQSPSLAQAAMLAHGLPDLLLLEDRAWPHADEAALATLRELALSRKLGLILSRRRGDAGSAGDAHHGPSQRVKGPAGHFAQQPRAGDRSGAAAGPLVVERPYDLAEVTAAMRAALLRRSAR